MTQTLIASLIDWKALPPEQQAHLRTSIPTADIVGIATPATQAELAATIRSATANHWQIVPMGQGSKLDWGGLIGGDRLEGDGLRPTGGHRQILVLHLAQINQLIDHAVGDMTVTVESGMRFADLQAILARAGQFLPIDPRFYDQATIGGVIATADAGSWRQRYSGVRDLLLGITFVRADGELVKAGGRVVKNVAGYDLMKLFTGAYGTLGVISQVTLRVYPIQPESQTIVVSGDVTKLAQLAQTLLSSTLTPTAIDWLSATAMTALGLRSEVGLIVRWQTVAASIAVQSQRLREWAQALALHSIVYPAVDEAELWQHIGAIGENGNVIAKFGSKGTETAAILTQIATIAPESMAIGHAGSGLGRLVLPTADGLAEIRALCESAGGFLSILRAPIAVKQSIDVWGYTGNAVDLMQAVKRQFDPDRVFNPDRFLGGI
jgi:glycolate oxidase FAD binding subunit